MIRPGIDPTNIRRAATRHRREVSRWWLERIAGAVVIMAIAFGVGTLQANYEGHNPHGVERTNP